MCPSLFQIENNEFKIDVYIIHNIQVKKVNSGDNEMEKEGTVQMKFEK